MSTQRKGKEEEEEQERNERKRERDLDDSLSDLGPHVLEGDVLAVLDTHHHRVDPDRNTGSILQSVLHRHLGDQEQ